MDNSLRGEVAFTTNFVFPLIVGVGSTSELATALRRACPWPGIQLMGSSGIMI